MTRERALHRRSGPVVPELYTTRIRDWVRPRYDVPALMALLGVSRFRAVAIRSGQIDWAVFLMLFEREGLSFVTQVLGISKGDIASGGVISLLMRHEQETRSKRDELEAAAGVATSQVPEVVERQIDEALFQPGSPMSTWLRLWRDSPRIEMAKAIKMASGDPSGRVGLMSRARTATAFTCRHIGSTLRFLNAGGVRLLGSTTVDWGLNPYLANCAEAYCLAADRGRPVLQEVAIRAASGLAPDEPTYLRLLIPFMDRRHTTLVIVVSEPVYPTYGGTPR